jgi:hypothetical protein
MKIPNPLHVCRVCGYDMGYPIWDDDGLGPTFDICACCGCEFGFNDVMYGAFNENDISPEFRHIKDMDLQSVKEYRKRWLGGEIKNIIKKPSDAALKEQMKNIPEEWR